MTSPAPARLTAVIVEAMKEQQQEIQDLQKQIDEQKALIEALKALACSQNPTAEICKRKN